MDVRKLTDGQNSASPQGGGDGETDGTAESSELPRGPRPPTPSMRQEDDAIVISAQEFDRVEQESQNDRPSFISTAVSTQMDHAHFDHDHKDSHLDKDTKCCFCFPRIPFCAKHCNEEIQEARRNLVMLVVDWVVDVTVGCYHFKEERWLAGSLTFAIVFLAGCLVTFTNFTPYMQNKKIIREEMKKMSKVYWILMHIPSFYPICTARLRLHFTRNVHTCCEQCTKEEMQCKLTLFKEKALWDGCCESTFEAYPQAVLQFVLLFDKDKNFNDWFDYVPILTIVSAVYGIAVAPVAIMKVRFPDLELSILQRVTIFASKAVRVLCCGLFVASFRNFLEGHALWLESKELWTVLPTVFILILLEGPYLLKYEIQEGAGQGRKWEDCLDASTDVMLVLLTVGTGALWVISDLKEIETVKGLVTTSIYALFMVFTYCGMIVHRPLIRQYQDVAEDVLVQSYAASKGWILKKILRRKKVDVF